MPGHGLWVAYSLSVSWASKGQWDWHARSATCEWWSWRGSVRYNTPPPVTWVTWWDLMETRDSLVTFRPGEFPMSEWHCLTPTLGPLELISYWADNRLKQTQELSSIFIKEVLSAVGVMWRGHALEGTKLVSKSCGGRAWLPLMRPWVQSAGPGSRECST